MGWSEDDLRAKGFDREGRRIKKNSGPGRGGRTPALEGVGDAPVANAGLQGIFIPYEVRSKKNSKIIAYQRDRNGKLMWNKGGTPKAKLINSRAVQQYITATRAYYKAFCGEFQDLCKGRDYPLRIEFTFIRSTRGKFDYNNIGQLVQDLMVKYHWIEEDDADHLIPVYAPYRYDKDNPGVLIRVL